MCNLCYKVLKQPYSLIFKKSAIFSIIQKQIQNDLVLEYKTFIKIHRRLGI